ncbi:hypothetical protein, partial [Corallococcus praedator]|uniref:hypothetical protein n=1 Tax=Corallococcus praedator TaxID=2316724 RepID=UPI001ABEF359
ALLLEEFNASDADPAADPGRTIARVDYRLNRFLAQERKIRRQPAARRCPGRSPGRSPCPRCC